MRRYAAYKKAIERYFFCLLLNVKFGLFTDQLFRIIINYHKCKEYLRDFGIDMSQNQVREKKGGNLSDLKGISPRSLDYGL